MKNDPRAQMLNIVGSDSARINQLNMNIYGIQPSMFDASLDDFMSTNVVTDSALSLAEQLYSARGS
jgi:hypothetical protein